VVQDRLYVNRQPYTPKEVKTKKSGLRPSFAKIIAPLDTSDPIFPKVAATLRDMADAGVELDAKAVEIAVKLVQQVESHRNDMRARRAALRDLPKESEDDRDSIVYYIRRGDLIKIGCTTRPKKRFESLLPDEILAVEPGGKRLETMRHRQFLHARQGMSEYFHQTTDLLEHVAAVRDLHGDPDPYWRTTQNVGQSHDTDEREQDIPPSLGMGTAIEAARTIGVNRNTIYSWVHRGRLQSIGRDEKGTQLYWFGDVWRLVQVSQGAHRRP
jgi:hypothetical protein